jgi:hypothetical protein
MKIVSVDRIDNDIHATLEDGSVVLLDWAWIIENKPQIGDEFPQVEAEVVVDAPVAPVEPVVL